MTTSAKPGHEYRPGTRVVTITTIETGTDKPPKWKKPPVKPGEWLKILNKSGKVTNEGEFIDFTPPNTICIRVYLKKESYEYFSEPKYSENERKCNE